MTRTALHHLAHLTAAAGLALASVVSAQTPVGSAMTYQARLEIGGAVYTGAAQIRMTPWNAAVAGSPLAATQELPITVEGGLFTVEYNPSLTFFETNAQAWLEVEIRVSESDPWTALPRQKITAAPFSSATRGLYVAGSGGSSRIGIGASAPAGVKLLVTETTNAPAVLAIESPAQATLEFRRQGVARWALTKDASDRLLLTQGATTVMNFRDAGSWSFGPSLPLNPRSWSRVLNIQAAPNGEAAVLYSASSGNDYWYAGRTTDGKFTFLGGAATGASATVSVPILEIRGGSDIAEPYDVAATDGVAPTPGMVVSIDPTRVGKLRVASGSYDRMVAGIISGANGVNTGLTLTQSGSIADGDLPIAKVGRVWCLADASVGEIRAGDLLTTAETPGHAMKAGDIARSQGAILGKAMSDLKSGKGYVLVLVGLQ